MSAGGPAYAGRMRRYLSAMFPLPLHVGFAALLYLAVALFVRDVVGSAGSIVAWPTVLGIGSTFGALLILRLMDELKDRDIDACLFPERPLPSGLVLESDVRRTLVAVCIVFVAANAVSVQTAVAAVAVLGFAALMFLHFLARDALRASLLLTLATHQPIVPLVLLHAFAVATWSLDADPLALPLDVVVPFVLVLWMPILGWEIGRKIRAPEQETDYVTYTRVLGLRGAVAFALVVQGIAAAAGAWLFVRLSLSVVYAAVLAVSFAWVAWTHVRFLRRPVAANAVSKPVGQAYLVVLAALQFVELGVLR